MLLQSGICQAFSINTFYFVVPWEKRPIPNSFSFHLHQKDRWFSSGLSHALHGHQLMSSFISSPYGHFFTCFLWSILSRLQGLQETNVKATIQIVPLNLVLCKVSLSEVKPKYIRKNLICKIGNIDLEQEYLLHSTQIHITHSYCKVAKNWTLRFQQEFWLMHS